MSGSTYKMVCPDCGSPIRVRNSYGQHALLRGVCFQCTNLNCGAVFNGNLEITHRLSPSAMPNPEINLPDAPSAMRRKVAQKEGEKQMGFDDLLDIEEEQGATA
jgi:hypothetical protein